MSSIIGISIVFIMGVIQMIIGYYGIGSILIALTFVIYYLSEILEELRNKNSSK